MENRYIAWSLQKNVHILGKFQVPYLKQGDDIECYSVET